MALAEQPTRSRLIVFAGSARFIELLLLITIGAALARAVSFLFSAGYLPPPFVYDTFDDFMDWYNTAYWANNSGAYDAWESIYPPLSFIFLKIFSIGSCYQVDSIVGRDCDWLGRATLFAVYLTNIAVVLKSYRLHDPRTAVMRTAALTLGLPMLFALDRGNLIVPCFTAFALAHGGVLRSTRLRWLAAALSVNFKPYLIVALVGPLLRRRWRWLEGCAVTCALVYLASYAIWGAGSPGQIVANIVTYSRGESRGLFEATFYPTSYSSITNYFANGVALTRFVGSRPIEIVTTVLPMLVRLGQVGVVVAFAGVALARAATPVHRLVAMSVALALSTAEVGGYAEVFLLFLVFFEPWRGVARVTALVCTYLLCIPADVVLVPLAHKVQDSYLTNQTVGYNLSVNLGTMVRPGLLLIIQYALSAATLVDTARAARARRAPGAPPTPRSVAPQRA